MPNKPVTPQSRQGRLAWGALPLLVVAVSGCLLSGSTPPSANNALPSPPAPAPEAAGSEAPAKVVPAAETKGIAFDGARAFKHLEKQVAIGPRVPNLPSHRECKKYLADTLKPLADSVELQEFAQPAGAKNLAMANVIARWKGSGSGKNGVLLCAHWDTRPTADYERTSSRRKTPIPGANDGASGVAVLLEAARLFKQQPPPVPVMIVLFDGEDVGPGVDQMFFGSRYFAAHLPDDVPRRGVLLDMIGDRELRIPQEQYSLQKAGDVVAEVYKVAERLGYQRELPSQLGLAIEDDHLPLLQRGLRVIDLIDFDYGPGHSWWHTLEDTPDKCSPASLKAVGEVVVQWVYSQQR